MTLDDLCDLARSFGWTATLVHPADGEPLVEVEIHVRRRVPGAAWGWTTDYRTERVTSEAELRALRAARAVEIEAERAAR